MYRGLFLLAWMELNCCKCLPHPIPPPQAGEGILYLDRQLRSGPKMQSPFPLARGKVRMGATFPARSSAR